MTPRARAVAYSYSITMQKMSLLKISLHSSNRMLILTIIKWIKVCMLWLIKTHHEFRKLMLTMITMQISNNSQMMWFNPLCPPRIGITEQKEDAVSYISVLLFSDLFCIFTTQIILHSFVFLSVVLIFVIISFDQICFKFTFQYFQIIW